MTLCFHLHGWLRNGGTLLEEWFLIIDLGNIGLGWVMVMVFLLQKKQGCWLLKCRWIPRQ